MPYRDDPETLKILPVLAKVISDLAKEHSKSSKRSKKYLLSIVTHMCRELEDFIEPSISHAAFAMAKARGLPDLRQFHWDDQLKKMKDTKRKIFHWEHVTPARALAREILAMPDPSSDRIEEKLLTAEVAWILKDEDKKLIRLGFRSKRERPKECYSQADIKFV